MQYISKEEQHTTEWSGGTTTELYLYPPDGSYKERKFLVRLSTAICRDENSVFTKLSDTQRILMVLDGEISLSHGDGKWEGLKPGEQISFSGEENTISQGTCQDFNLMLKEGATGNLVYVSVMAGEKHKIFSDADNLGIYLVRGNVIVFDGEEHQEMQSEDFLLLGTEKGETVVTAIESSIFVVAKIYLNIK